jgi:NADPH-ferrihemoprotein reductase
MATYGEGEPTDNAVTLMQNLTEDGFEFADSEGKERSEVFAGLKYVVFGLGNRTYEHYNLIARQLDKTLTDMGATRIGERGEGDDDKSMEEDYLAWKDGMWDAFATAMGVEEGQGGDSPDFAVSELDQSSVVPEKVYLGELSARALTKTRGIHDAKNPYASPITVARELFQSTTDRNCVHMEFDITGSGITYQHGDHVGVWPSNPSIEVDRLLCALGLYDKKDTVIGIESLDPALAKVPFPVPTTYETVLRHYIDISAVAGRQMLGTLSKFAPTPEAAERLYRLSSNKEEYLYTVANGCLKVGEVLQISAGDDAFSPSGPTPQNTTAWKIPFDIIVSSIPRLQPRYYSISSSPKLHPNSIHVTCVVLKYENDPPRGNNNIKAKMCYGVGSNFLLHLKCASAKEDFPPPGVAATGIANSSPPAYAIEGPRGSYSLASAEAAADSPLFKCPVHVRRSTFRLPTNPKSPVLMIGPGTGVAPFRGFIQERVALARRSLEKNGPDALKEWGPITLYYGCRRSDQDFLYKDEWEEYKNELKGKFEMHCAFSRQVFRPDGGKIYVQDLMWDNRKQIAEAVIDGKGYVYICGDAKGMGKGVEECLTRILGIKKLGGDLEGDAPVKNMQSVMEEGAKEVKVLKERSRMMLDVWS